MRSISTTIIAFTRLNLENLDKERSTQLAMSRTFETGNPKINIGSLDAYLILFFDSTEHWFSEIIFKTLTLVDPVFAINKHLAPFCWKTSKQFRDNE